MLTTCTYGLVDMLESGKCRALLKTHILTGCDFTSTVGSKYNPSAIYHSPTVIVQLKKLPKMIMSTNKQKNIIWTLLSLTCQQNYFDHLRYMIWINRKIKIVDLPPTSSTSEGHLRINETVFFISFILNFNMANLLKDIYYKDTTSQTFP